MTSSFNFMYEGDPLVKLETRYINAIPKRIYDTRYSRMDQVKSVKTAFKKLMRYGLLKYIDHNSLLGSFLNTLSHIVIERWLV